MKRPTIIALSLILLAVLSACDQGLTFERIYPDEVYDTRDIGFAQVIATQGGKHVFVAGTVAYDKDRNIVGAGDVGAQLDQVFKNLKLSLAAAGATPDDVVRMRIFIVDYNASYRPALGKAMEEFYSDNRQRATSTLIGVQALATEDFLVEVDVTAVID